MTHMIDELYRKQIDYMPQINLEKMMITLKLRESTFEKIGEAF